MKMLSGTIALIATTMLFAGCSGTVEKSSAGNANAPASNAPAAAKPSMPTADALLAIEKKSWEDWGKKDAKGIDGFLAAKFVGVSRTGATDREGTLKTWTEHKCELASASFSDAKVTPIADGVVMLTSKVTHDIKCEGKAEPSPVYESTLYVKEGETWKAAYYQEVNAADAKGESTPPQPRKEDLATSLSAPSAEIAALEKALWDTWKARDQKAFEPLLAANAFSHGRNGYSDRAQSLKNTFDPECKIDSYEFGPMKSMEIAKDVILVTYRATQKGTCGKDAIPGVVMATSINIKENGKWVNLYYMENPGV